MAAAWPRAKFKAMKAVAPDDSARTTVYLYGVDALCATPAKAIAMAPTNITRFILSISQCARPTYSPIAVQMAHPLVRPLHAVRHRCHTSEAIVLRPLSKLCRVIAWVMTENMHSQGSLLSTMSVIELAKHVLQNLTTIRAPRRTESHHDRLTRSREKILTKPPGPFAFIRTRDRMQRRERCF